MELIKELLQTGQKKIFMIDLVFLEKFQKIESDLPGVGSYDKEGKKLDGKYANVKSYLSKEDIFDKKRNKLKGSLRKRIQFQLNQMMTDSEIWEKMQTMIKLYQDIDF